MQKNPIALFPLALLLAAWLLPCLLALVVWPAAGLVALAVTGVPLWLTWRQQRATRYYNPPHGSGLFGRW
jgi:hypothetical protein